MCSNTFHPDGADLLLLILGREHLAQMRKTYCIHVCIFIKTELFWGALRLKGMMCAVWQRRISSMLHCVCS